MIYRRYKTYRALLTLIIANSVLYTYGSEQEQSAFAQIAAQNHKSLLELQTEVEMLKRNCDQMYV